MVRRFWLLGVVLWAGFALAPRTACAAGGHPHFNDQGTLPWFTRWSDALATARAQGKLVLVEFGRLRCVSCRTLVSEVIPDPQVRARLSQVAVGLAADCDTPEKVVDDLFAQHLPGADMLPFVAFLSPAGTWIRGFQGGRSVAEFLADLAAAEKAVAAPRASAPEAPSAPPAAPAPAHDRALALAPAPAPASAPAAPATRPTPVPAVAPRLPVPPPPPAPTVQAAVAPVAPSASRRAWAEAQFAFAVSAARLRRYDDALAAADLVRTSLPGQPEALDAVRGLEAIRTARELSTLDPRGVVATTLSRNAAERVAGTRWTALFR